MLYFVYLMINKFLSAGLIGSAIFNKFRNGQSKQREATPEGIYSYVI